MKAAGREFCNIYNVHKLKKEFAMEKEFATERV